MKRYNDLSSWLKKQIGCKVFKVSLTAETTCPNIDGTLAKGGCTFCNDAAYSPMIKRRSKPIARQLEEGIAYVRQRHHTSKCVAYFQSFTSTYGDREILLGKFRESLAHPDIIGFALSTRPDCIDKEWVKSLSRLADGKLCWIEIGLQSAVNSTLARINRWHTRRQFEESVRLIKLESRISICAHTVIGLPGEKMPEVLETAKFLTTQPVDGIKIHNLHVVKGTQLAQDFLEGRYAPPTLEEFVDSTLLTLEWTPPQVLIHRINAHAPRHLTLAPDWSVNKLAIFNAVEAELKRRNAWQGKSLGFSGDELSKGEFPLAPCL